jgi:hypothetical protein
MNLTKQIERLRQRCGHNPLALITGGSSGMGLIYAQKLAEAGCDLLLVSNQEVELGQTAFEMKGRFGVRAIARYQDLSARDAAESLLAFCREQSLEVDILINNAGMFFFEELSPENEAKALTMLQLHVYTPTRLCVLLGEEMKRRGYGYILNVSSMAAKLPCPGIAVYSATKAYLKSFTKSLYYEMRPYGVVATVVCPAAIATPLYKLKPSLMKLGVKVGLIGTPEWLVRRALRGLFRKRRVVKPGLMNYYLPPLVAILPKGLVDRIWRKVK